MHCHPDSSCSLPPPQGQKHLGSSLVVLRSAHRADRADTLLSRSLVTLRPPSSKPHNAVISCGFRVSGVIRGLIRGPADAETGTRGRGSEKRKRERDHPGTFDLQAGGPGGWTGDLVHDPIPHWSIWASTALEPEDQTVEVVEEETEAANQTPLSPSLRLSHVSLRPDVLPVPHIASCLAACRWPLVSLRAHAIPRPAMLIPSTTSSLWPLLLRRRYLLPRLPNRHPQWLSQRCSRWPF